MIKITLPWPNFKVLSPNANHHWTKISKAKKKARADARWCVYGCIGLNSDQAESIRAMEIITFDIIFHPPDKHSRDVDNLLSSQKSALDGVADALGVNDSKFRPIPDIGDIVKHGKVVIIIHEKGD